MLYKFFEISCVDDGENNFSQTIHDAVEKGKKEGYLLDNVQYSTIFDHAHGKMRSAAFITMYKSEI